MWGRNFILSHFLWREQQRSPHRFSLSIYLLHSLCPAFLARVAHRRKATLCESSASNGVGGGSTLLSVRSDTLGGSRRTGRPNASMHLQRSPLALKSRHISQCWSFSDHVDISRSGRELCSDAIFPTLLCAQANPAYCAQCRVHQSCMRSEQIRFCTTWACETCWRLTSQTHESFLSIILTEDNEVVAHSASSIQNVNHAPSRILGKNWFWSLKSNSLWNPLGVFSGKLSVAANVIQIQAPSNGRHSEHQIRSVSLNYPLQLLCRTAVNDLGGT